MTKITPEERKMLAELIQKRSWSKFTGFLEGRGIKNVYTEVFWETPPSIIISEPETLASITTKPKSISHPMQETFQSLLENIDYFDAWDQTFIKERSASIEKNKNFRFTDNQLKTIRRLKSKLNTFKKKDHDNDLDDGNEINSLFRH